MKKRSLFLLFTLSALLAFGGCGSTKEPEPLSPSDLAETIETPVESSEVESTESTPVENPVDIPPEEGMVHSALTNEWISEELANSRPIAVMFPTDRNSQPQYGIGLAGVLYECMEEGGMSRQMGIIEDWKDLELIGNIRSCRDYYAYWSLEWDSFLVHWGGPFYLVDVVKRDDVHNLSACGIGAGDIVAPATGSSAFYRYPKGSEPSIHNGFTDGPKLAATIEALKYPMEHREEYYQPKHFSFMPMTEVNTLEDAKDSFEAKEISLSKIFPTTKSSFSYDEETGVYKKYLYGSPQIDQLTGEQLTFENIIIQDTYWEYRPDNKYLVFQVHDKGRSGYYYTKGRGIKITWSKESDYAPTRYFDMDGNEIQLNTGHTFIGVAQAGREPIVK